MAGAAPERPFPAAPLVLPLTVVLGERRLRLTARTSPLALIGTYASGHWAALVPGLLGRRDRDWLDDELSDDEAALDLPHIYAAATTAGALLAGTSWAAACRLANVAASNWMAFDGWAVEHGFDPHTAPLHRTLAGVYRWMRNPEVVQNEEHRKRLTEMERQIFRKGARAVAGLPAELGGRKDGLKFNAVRGAFARFG